MIMLDALLKVLRVVLRPIAGGVAVYDDGNYDDGVWDDNTSPQGFWLAR